MTELERNQIKGALLKCADENAGKETYTGHVVVSSVCRSAVERIEELEKEVSDLQNNAENIIRDLYFVIQGRIDYTDNIPLIDTMNRAKSFIKGA